MLRHHLIDRICCIVLAAVLLLTCGLMSAVSLGAVEGSRSIGYENRLFDQQRVHTIDIVMNDWEGFLQTCADEQYAACDVVIDGEHYSSVGIRAKGNTSLSSVQQYGNNRYSFKIEFDHYQTGKTYHGLDKLSLNNLIQDKTYLKDYLAYTLMNRMGAASPLCSFVQINVNGEPWGLYLAVEAVEDSFLLRTYGANHGELYKPDSLSFGGGPGNGKDFSMDDFREQFNAETAAEAETTETENPFASFGGGFAPPDMGGFDFSSMPDMGSFDFSSMPDMGGFDFSSMPDMGGGFGGGVGSSDVRLQYIDDNPESYQNIFNSAKTDVTETDQQRLIASLKALSEGTDIESVVDVEAVIRYLAVHHFMCNDDSYTGMMVHNYYLYEEDGRLSMLPWDYNLALGGFSMGGFGSGSGATSTVNSPIDSPVSMGDVSSRPMVAWIFQSEEYTALYHQIYDEFISSVFESGWFLEEVERVGALIAPYVENDVNGFFTYEEFQTGLAALKEFCTLRAESIRGQLEGTIPSTTAEQRTQSSALIDASHIDLADMGEFGMGGGNGFPGMPGSSGQQGDFPAAGAFSGTNMPGDTSSANPFGGMPDSFEMPAMPMGQGQPPADAAQPAPEAVSDQSAEQTGAPVQKQQSRQNASSMPESFSFPGMGSAQQSAPSDAELLVWLAASAAVLAGAILFALLYRSGR